MSPEQCQGKPLDPASDIYSIGILLYEMLAGAVPFDGESVLQVVYDQLHAPPRHLKELAPDVPESIAQVVMRALEKEPAERQASAIQLSDELKQAVEMAGDGGSLPITNPLVFRPLDSTSIRRPSIETSTTAEERHNTPPSLHEKHPLPFGRETAALSRKGADPTSQIDVTSSQFELGRSTTPDQKALAAQKPVDLEAETEEFARKENREPGYSPSPQLFSLRWWG